MADLDDHMFLAEPAHQRDLNPPPAYLSAAAVTEAFEASPADAAPIVQRLRARGLIAYSDAPTRIGADTTSRDLILTPAGYQRLGL